MTLDLDWSQLKSFVQINPPSIQTTYYVEYFDKYIVFYAEPHGQFWLTSSIKKGESIDQKDFEINFKPQFISLSGVPKPTPPDAKSQIL